MKRTKKRIFAVTGSVKSAIMLGLSFFFPAEVQAQQETESYFKEGISPQVALMNQYGDYPVDLMNGLVDITIPLYNIQTTSLSMPLALKFHASGLRADEREGPLGIRWVLSGLGHVSRSIKGYPDNDGTHPFNDAIQDPSHKPTFYDLYGTTDHNNVTYFNDFQTDWGTPVSIAGGTYQDTEHDIYSYSLPNGKAGKFISDNGTGYSMPYEPLKIYNDNMHYITIIDENGTTYYFGDKFMQGGLKYSDTNNDNKITTWYLSLMISANKQDTILIDYKRSNVTGLTQRENSLVISNELHDNDAFLNYPDDCYDSPLYALWGELLESEYFLYKDQRLTSQRDDRLTASSIRFRSSGRLIGSIDFVYDAKNKYLEYMIVRNASNVTAKTIHFEIGNNLSGKLKFLNKVNISGQGQYDFGYYDSGSVPACGELATNSDWFGYYSSGGGWFYGQTVSFLASQAGYSTDHTVTRTIQGGQKASDSGSMKIGMIQSVKYPTGGKTTFEYEANRDYNGATGGLRIAKIINTPESGKTETKSFKYGRSDNGIGITPEYFLRPPANRWKNHYVEHEIEGLFTTDELCPGGGTPYYGDYGGGRYIQRIFLNSIPDQYTELHSNTTTYNTVTEYYENTTGEKLKTVYEYDVWCPPLSFYKNDQGNDFTGYGGASGYMHGYVSPTDFWAGNKLIGKTIYKNNGAAKVKAYKYEYRSFQKTVLYDLPVFRYRYYDLVLTSDYSITKNKAVREKQLIYNSPYQAFAFVHQKYTIGAERLSRETEYTYHDDGSITTASRDMIYEGPYFFLKSETVTNSDSTVHATRYYYPFDYPADEDYEEMVDKNILNPVIEKSINTNGKSRRDKTLYKKWARYSFYPYSKIKNRTEVLSCHNYSSQGRPLYITVNNVKNIVYLWGYSQQYPVATIVNATYQQVCNALGGEDYVASLSDAIVLSSSDLAALDNLRAALPYAQVTTCTYKPLVGKLTETAPNGLTTYYEYDSSGRLKEVYRKKNNVKEVLESYEYNLINN